MKPDLVIRGGTIVDGTGAAPIEADIVIAGRSHHGDGHARRAGREEIDARGLIVTPGFVDVHTHLDAQITWDPLGTPSNLHGVTSVVVGNCGVGFAPCKPEDRDYLMFLMEGVEDIPQAAMRAGLRWNWESFPEYLDGARGTAARVQRRRAHQSRAAAHLCDGRARCDRCGAERRRARLRCAPRSCEAMRAGALGFATGRTTMHRTPAWEPVPGTFADRRELDALAGALAEEGRGVFEIVPYGGAGEDSGGVAKEFEWMTPVARDINRPISMGLVQNLAYPDTWREALRLAENAARAARARIVPQVAVRAVGILMGFGIAINPLSIYPGRRRSRRAAARAGRRALARSGGAGPPARERRRPQRRHPRRHGDARPRLSARARGRAAPTRPRRSAASRRWPQRGACAPSS